jgi:hypothetical protein
MRQYPRKSFNSRASEWIYIIFPINILENHFFKIAGALLCHLRKRSNCTSRAEANITTTQTMHTTKYNTTATWEKS